MIADVRLAREKQVNARVLPTIETLKKSVDLAHEVFYKVYRKVPDSISKSKTLAARMTGQRIDVQPRKSHRNPVIREIKP